MADLIDVLNHVSTWTKAAWMLWLVWSVVQIGWYRHFAVAGPAPQPERGPRLEQRHPEPKVRRPEDLTPTSESQSRPAEPEKRFGGTFISLGLDERRSASVDQPLS
jgi:hypothetical protein